MLLQGDYRVPVGACWWSNAEHIFRRFPRLGLLGGYNGQRVMSTDKYYQRWVWGAAAYATAIDRQLLTHSTIAVRFVRFVNLGPLLIRKDVFLALGGFKQSLSRPGEPGIGLDWDLSLRAWEANWHCAVYYAGFENGVGGRHTFSDPRQRDLRRQNQQVNFRNIRFHDLKLQTSKNLSEARIESLNGQLKPISSETAKRLQREAREHNVSCAFNAV